MKLIGDALTVTGAADLDSTLNVDGAVTLNDATTVKPGTASDTAKVGGVLYVSTAQVGNVGTGEDDLASYSVPANVLAANGQSIWFEAAGTVANTVNAKRLRIRFGTAGTNLVLDHNAFPTSAACQWMLRGRIIRTGAATQKAYATVWATEAGVSTQSNVTSIVTTLDQTLSGAITLRITGEATANNDVVSEGLVVGWSGENT